MVPTARTVYVFYIRSSWGKIYGTRGSSFPRSVLTTRLPRKRNQWLLTLLESDEEAFKQLLVDVVSST